MPGDVSTLRWGVLSTSRNARKRVVPAMQRAHGQSCIAIAGRAESKTRAFGEEFGIPRWVAGEHFDRILDDEAVDAVYISLPNSMHAEWTMRALAAGKHVLVEKPMCLTSDELEDILRMQQSTGAVLVENFSYQHSPGFQLLNEWVKRGILGNIQGVYIHFSFPATPAHKVRFDRALGGGCFADLGTYGIDFAHRLLGYRLEVKEVAAVPAYGEQEDWVSDPARRVESEFWCSMRGGLGTEVNIRTSFTGARVQYAHVFGEAAMVVLALAFVTDGAQTAVFFHRNGRFGHEVFEGVDQDLMLLQSFAERVSERGAVDTEDQRRWRRNAALIESIRARILE